MRFKSISILSMVMGIVLTAAPLLAEEIGRTPPRLSFIEGQVSFHRPGATDWSEARINIPLAPGDELYTGSPGNFELQIGARAFVRGWADTHIGLENHELDFMQFKVLAGYVALDLRDLPAGHTVEVDTPNAAFTIERPGYYRVDVDDDRTTFTTRRGGSASASPPGGRSITIASSEEVVFTGPNPPEISAYAAPPPDVWDQWNTDRTSDLIDALSDRYVSPDSYGTDDLDRYGTWRVVPTYGSVWIPGAVPAGWSPYSDGYWIMDPYYGWSWVDRAPWGWAPYHYGRWVHVNGYWAWTPGPLVLRPVYAPALVAFVGGPGLHFSVSFGSQPAVGWVALGWGEPCVPWWGRPGFVHRPWWGGWGGPHVVNGVVVHHHHVVQVEHIHHYHHLKHGRGVMAVHEKHFGRGAMQPMRAERVDTDRLKMHHALPRGHATPASFAPFEKQGRRPPQEHLQRSLVATRRPQTQARSERLATKPREDRLRIAAPSHLVAPPQKRREAPVVKRPPFGQGDDERPSRQRISQAPPARERETLQREPGGAVFSGRPDKSANRMDERERLPGFERRQDPESRVTPKSALPGRPANTLSPHSRERLLRHSEHQPRSAPGASPGQDYHPQVGRQRPEDPTRLAPGTSGRTGEARELPGRMSRPPGAQGQPPVGHSSPRGDFQPSGRSGRSFGGFR